jgi:tetratricopeptide (TPR) repeat protein
MKDDEKALPNELLQYERERRNWSREYVAEQIGVPEVRMVGRWERESVLPHPNYRQKLCNLFGKSARELGFVRQGEISFWNVPYRRNPFFTGREAMLIQIYELLAKKKAAALTQPEAISGLGGIGKTQVALEYAYRYGDAYQAVLWVRAESREVLTSDFTALATLLTLPEKDVQDQSKAVDAVKRWLATLNRWLLILDNVEDLPVIGEFLPLEAKGHVLLTTCSQATGPIAHLVEVDAMEPEEGALFLLRRAKIMAKDAPRDTASYTDWTQARAITEAMDGLPLALDQAGAYIEETKCSLAEYLALYETHGSALLRERGSLAPDHPQAVVGTFLLSFEKLQQANPAAADLLRLCSFLHPDAIPEAILTEGAAELGVVLSPVATDPLLLNAAIQVLRRYSLVKRDPEARLINMHRLVQVVLKQSLHQEVQQQWAERSVRALNRAFPVAEFASCERCELYLPHALLCAQWIEQDGFTFPEAARLLHTVGVYLRDGGRYGQAEPLLKRALSLREQVLGPEYPDTATTLNALAWLYVLHANYEQAEVLLQSALMRFERVLGAEHPEVAEALNTLAAVYQYKGKYDEAEPLFKRALAIREQALGKSHPLVAESLNNLALLYDYLGQYAQAEPLYQRALALHENTRGPEHPDALIALNNLAYLYTIAGKYAQAEPLYQRALATRERVLGPEHPTTGMSLRDLGRLYILQGKYAQAEPLLQRALALLERLLGPEHDFTIRAQLSLAQLSQATGQEARAESLYQRALASYESVLGPEHPLVAETLTSLAQLYTGQGHYKQAEPLLERALAIDEQVLGPEHPQTATALDAQGHLALLQGRKEQAKRLLQRTLAIQEKSLGNAHPDVAQTLHHLAKLYEKQGKHEQAHSLYQQALSIREHALGTDHPDTLAMREALTSHL